VSGPARLTVLGLCGSLRAASLNHMMLRAAARVAPPYLVLEIYPSLGLLPLFNPDLEAVDPLPVADLRRRITAADALAIASPEYAHGVSGVIKNALDWMVGNESFVLKRVAVFNASPRASHARTALAETLRTMSAVVIESASIELPLLGSGLDEDGIVRHPRMAPALRAALEALTSSGGGEAG
jgi:NAD(P)H-dependent FMN reductase